MCVCLRHSIAFLRFSQHRLTPAPEPPTPLPTRAHTFPLPGIQTRQTWCSAACALGFCMCCVRAILLPPHSRSRDSDSFSLSGHQATFLIVQGSNTGDYSDFDDALRQGARLCVWKDTAQSDFVQASYPKANIVPIDDHVSVRWGALGSVCCTHLA